MDVRPPVFPCHRPTGGQLYGTRYLNGVKGFHGGVDFAPIATTGRIPFHASAPGTIVKIVRDREPGQPASVGDTIVPGVSGNGPLIELPAVKGGSGFLGYGHGQTLTKWRVGDTVNTGDLLGYLDASGIQFGDPSEHIHLFALRADRVTRYDPLIFFASNGLTEPWNWKDLDDMYGDNDRSRDDTIVEILRRIEADITGTGQRPTILSWLKARLGGSANSPTMTDRLRESKANQVAMTAALKTLAEANGTDPDALLADIRTAVKEALAGAELTITID